jgi:DNA-binding XRE family transcriptional regulator
VHVIACLAEGLGIRGTARVFEVDPNTVLRWLVEAAEQLQAFSCHVLHDLRVRQVQMDELFALLSAVRDGEISEAEAIERLERSPQGVWVALDPESKSVLVIDVGNRTLALAQRVVHQVAQVLAPDCVPLFLTDGFREYLTALLTRYEQGCSRQAARPQAPPQATLDAATDTLKRTSFELGGKSPNVIFADADMDQAVADAFHAIYFDTTGYDLGQEWAPSTEHGTDTAHRGTAMGTHSQLPVGRLHNNLKALRLRLGMNQQELASRAGVTRQTISGVESGLYMPSTLVALRLARALGCRVEDLL